MIFKDNIDTLVELSVFGTEEKLTDEGHMLRESLQFLKECERIEEYEEYSFDEQGVILEFNRSITKGVRVKDLLNYNKEEATEFLLGIYEDIYNKKKMFN
tara:strand:- start:195 stop:494 length:300 start_codon:yes stop_codon:yes gene_type:complete